MSINTISISQDNKVGSSDLMPIHSPLVFLCDVQYTGEYPTSVYVDIIDSNSDVVETFRAIPYRDLLSNLRQFAFVANDVIKGLMDTFNDESQLTDTLVYLGELTKTYTLKFYDPENEIVSDETTVTFIHGAAQFGEDPNFYDIYSNEETIYYGANGQGVYVYFYNEDTNNVLVIDNPSVYEGVALSYDDQELLSYDDQQLLILTDV